jgi:glycosyltransferase involved in cell wall biosynthesis
MEKPFKIHCIALTKNEADVIGLCLTEAAKWADHIYVYDGQSTDGTWEIVKSLNHPRIIPWKQDGKVFKEGLRAEVFDEFRHLSSEGDWWLQLNVDEFYPEDPRTFFQRVPPAHGVVWGTNVEYYLTEKDIEELDFSQSFERIRPALRYYKVFWSEPRAFRYRPRLVWNPEWAWPRHPGLVAKERIIFKHYPYRSPQQIQMRLDVRRDNRSRGFAGWDHAKELNWKSKIVSHQECRYDDRCSPLRIIESELPCHLELLWMRSVKRVMHGTGMWP